MDMVAKLYRNYEILADAKDKIGEHEQEYLEILEAVKGNSNEKRLASQFSAHYFKYFPNLAERSIDAQLDLCEDEDVAIRKQAIKDFPTFCKDRKEYVPKIADALVQLLQVDDLSELAVVHNSLMVVCNLDCKASLEALFKYIIEGDDNIRERAIKFLCTKVKALPADILTREIEELILFKCRTVMQDVTGDEFMVLIGMLSGLKAVKTIAGQQSMVEMIAEQADMDKSFDPTDAACVYKLIQCIRQAMPYFSPYVGSGRFLSYTCASVLPGLGDLVAPQEGLDLGLEILKLMAEMAPHAANLEDVERHTHLVFDKLLEYMPLPPAEDVAEIVSSPTEQPKLQFSHVECLMYTFHQLAKKNPEFLTAEDSTERLRDFKLRLQYLARGIQGYIKKLREAVQGKKVGELKTEENKVKVVALKTTTNINLLIRDLFHNPPSYKTAVTLSWKNATAGSGVASSGTSNTVSPAKPDKPTETGQKRPARVPITFEDSGAAAKKTTKGARELYSPPSGKYSAKVKNFQAPTAVRARGSGFGRGRGRGWRGGSY